MSSSKFEPNDDILDFVIKKANGLKGLVDTNLEIIPNQCIQPKEQRLDKSQIDNQESIPTINLSNFDDLNVEKSIQEAASKWGFFQIINHGIPIEVLENLKDAAHKFFELPAEEKVKYHKEKVSPGESVLMFWSAIGEKDEKVLEWRDTIRHGCNPQNDSNLWPPQTRNQVLEYQKWAKPLAKKLLEVLLKGLNVNEINESLEPLLMGTMSININYYPSCPNPSIAIGFRRHCDMDCITLLLQDNTGGLYVRGTKDNWIHVNPIKGALAVNIGDSLQIMSNDRYKSIEHCVVVDSSRARISIPLFVNPSFDSVIGSISTNAKRWRKTKAASKWGFFQIINHGIPIEVLENLIEAGHKFFELPAEEKVKYYKENTSVDESVFLYWSAIGDKDEKVLEWRDSIKHGCNPQNDSNLWPPETRNQVLEYQKWAKPLAKKLLKVLLKGHNVNEIDESLEPLLMGTMAISINYYPPCPNPSITIGCRRHCDVSCITLLLQDDTGGLYVRGTKGDNWIHVNPIKGALAVNIGNSLQIMSNDRYKVSSIVQQLIQARLEYPLDSVIGPFPQMLKDGEKPVYKHVLFSDYWNYFFSKRPSESIPTIDLSNFDDLSVEKSIQEATSKWGFFQIINHGIPIEVLEDLKEAGHKLFELPAKEKVKYYKENSAIGEKDEKVLEWRDSTRHGCNPQNDNNLWPPQTRNQVLEYQKWATPLAKKLLEVLLKGLNVNEIDESLEPLLMGTMAIIINYYPPCPNPNITIGCRRHCDVSCITLLLQDDTGGLYVRGTKGDNWILVNPIKSSLQIMSNDRYKSIEHCATVDSSRARISVLLFLNPNFDSVIGPFQ
ncbi:hypothetical protein H5410_058583 [Solanum commersonii]|uniref:feruloyl-CoA 6-hydroxylase n=1 Tax=Solanum commersonii TaxID=4109 RepID=A0A9J5WRI1_SOLCO|nr:hypothetical protein H5410_058583 [Solanum commersonii]